MEIQGNQRKGFKFYVWNLRCEGADNVFGSPRLRPLSVVGSSKFRKVWSSFKPSLGNKVGCGPWLFQRNYHGNPGGTWFLGVISYFTHISRDGNLHLYMGCWGPRVLTFTLFHDILWITSVVVSQQFLPQVLKKTLHTLGGFRGPKTIDLMAFPRPLF